MVSLAMGLGIQQYSYKAFQTITTLASGVASSSAIWYLQLWEVASSIALWYLQLLGLASVVFLQRFSSILFYDYYYGIFSYGSQHPVVFLQRVLCYYYFASGIASSSTIWYLQLWELASSIILWYLQLWELASIVFLQRF